MNGNEKRSAPFRLKVWGLLHQARNEGGAGFL